MSRSYKKFPRVKDKNPGMKQIANRKFRRSNKFEDIPLNEHGYYRKCMEPCDICDYKLYYPFEEFLRDLDHDIFLSRRHVCGETAEEHKDWWEHHYKRK